MSPALLGTVKSILESKNVGNFRFIVVSDSVPMTQKLHGELKKLGVEIYENKKPGTLAMKMKQILSMVKTDIFIFTQDDLMFDKYAINNVIETFENDSQVTMVVSRVKSLPPKIMSLVSHCKLFLHYHKMFQTMMRQLHFGEWKMYGV